MKESASAENPEEEVIDENEVPDTAQTEVNGVNSLIINESVLNGDDSRDSSFNQLSIDIGESENETPKPTIRIAKGLQKEPSTDNIYMNTSYQVVSVLWRPWEVEITNTVLC